MFGRILAYALIAYVVYRIIRKLLSKPPPPPDSAGK